MEDYLEERLLTYIHGPKGEAGIFEALEPDDGSSYAAIVLPDAYGRSRRYRVAYIVRFKESVTQSYATLGEAYLASGNLVGVEAGFGARPGQFLSD